MHIERLKYIYEVSLTNSISIASQNLHVTQSAISQAISSVEDELGVKIFNRDRQGTNLTFEGKQLIETIKELLQNYQKLIEQSVSLQNEPSEVLKIATIPGHMATILKTFSKLKKNHPNVSLNVVEKGSKEIVEGVIKQKYDFGFIQFRDYLMNDLKKVRAEVLLRSPIHICTSKSSHLALKNSVTINDLKDESFVLYNDDYLNSLTEYLKDFPMNVLFVTDNLEVIRGAVIEDLAITFDTCISLKNEASILNGQTVSIPLIDVEPLTVPIGWIRSNSSFSSNLYEKFINLLKIELEWLAHH
ncbi:LysR family transcriptional regulator [Gottfriedia sp. NPDC057948]|uniref:LysR family transcriptional regulator n=1 Tax=Gottfriedia sp. NPDC057948 TaxID=3346287 RepID=UPI0036DBA0A9